MLTCSHYKNDILPCVTLFITEAFESYTRNFVKSWNIIILVNAFFFIWGIKRLESYIGYMCFVTKQSIEMHKDLLGFYYMSDTVLQANDKKIHST